MMPMSGRTQPLGWTDKEVNMMWAILDGIGYALFIACIYIVLVVGGSL
jgi:hypothetical protein